LADNLKKLKAAESKGEVMINQNDVFNPVPRFERIEMGICPDCNGRLDHTGGCDDCHIVPALDPDFQKWLEAGKAEDKTMFNTDLAEIKKMKGGNLGIKTPFNGEFKDELKALIPSAKWQSPYWIINPSGEEQAKELLAKYYPPKDQLQKVRIEWDLNRDDPQIDGTRLASISRDWWNWRKDCPIDFKVIEQDLSSGGSRKNPGLYGHLVIEADIRPDASFYPAAEVTVVASGEAPNPLAAFSTEELLAELKARGIK
jgi:hypothetical protein